MKKQKRKATNDKLCCDGKGYATVFAGDTIAFADFDSEDRRLRKGGIRIKLCKCQRGHDLAKYFTIKKKFKQ